MADRDDKGHFQPGHRITRKGARNKLHADFVVAMAENFAEHGKSVIDIVRIEEPAQYLKIAVSLLPKEFILEDGRMESMTDDELAEHLENIRNLRAVREATAGSRGAVIEGTATQVEGKSSRVLPRLS